MLQANLEEMNVIVEEMHTRLQVLEHSHNRMKEAFVLNDLKVADYDGHRVAHLAAIDRDKITKAYQRDAAGAGIKYVVAGFIGVFVLGVLAWLKEHLK
jgi:hypothetical protein